MSARPDITLDPAPAVDDAAPLHRQGPWPQADELHHDIRAFDRGDSGALHHLGVLRLQQGRPQEAVVLIGEALERDPHIAVAHNDLGIALQSLGRQREAISHYEQAIAIRSDFAEAYYNLGTALQALRRPGDAVGRFEQAVLLRPNHAASHYALATAFHALQRHDDAMARYEQALVIAPDHVDALAARGVALVELGHIDQARDAFARAIELAPRRAGLYRDLADCKRFIAGDRHLAAMEALAADTGGLPGDDQVALHFALAKAYADIQRHDRAIEQLRLGNALKRQRIVYDETMMLGLFERIEAVFTHDLMQRSQKPREPSSVPVFIIGMPRSGTTLIEQILASHPAVFAAGELPDFSAAVAGLARPEAPGIRFPEIVPSLSAHELHQFGGRYLAALRGPPAAQRVTDKMPTNFLFAGLIHRTLPNARIIHIHRDPVDTCFSCFSTLFAAGQPYAYDLGELGRYYRAYEGLMAHWRRILPAGVMLDVRYEDVITDFDGQARRIVAHCGLDWHDGCRRFYEARRPVGTASAAQVRRPIYRGSIGRSEPYRVWLQPLLDALAFTP